MNKILILSLILLSSCGSSYEHLMEDVANFDKDNHFAVSKNTMIATQGKSASLAGKEILKQGGNVIDAMAAISFVISVERPQSTGLGGGGFLLYHSKKENKTFAFDFRESAPNRSTKDMYLDKNGNIIDRKSLDGIFAVGVPGLVKGVLDIHKKYGNLSREEVLKHSISLAEKGFVVYPEMDVALKVRKNVLCKYPSSQKIFCPKGILLKTGDHLKQLDLAKTLKLIAKQGTKAFYNGAISKKIVKTSKQYKGLLTSKDFRDYTVKNRIPIVGTFRGKKIVSMPPPSSGGVHIIEILNILENHDLKKLGQYHPETIHYVSSAMEMAFADRAKYLGDDDFVAVPKNGLTSKKYAKVLYNKIDSKKAFNSKELGHGLPWKFEPEHTTHFSIMDKEGNVVVSTQTINGYFGSGLVAEGTGIVLNNEMDDFANKVGAVNLFGAVGGEKNLAQPKKRPLSSVSPTIVFDDNGPIMAVGTPSGTRILTCVMQTILNFIEFDMPLYESVASARYHHQWRPHQIRFDETDLDPKTISSLENMGHKFIKKNLGCRIQAVSKKGNLLMGASDPRGEGKATGI